jgi:release factor glutamine methyltransferase
VTVRPAEVVRRGAEYLAHHGVEAPEANAELLMMKVLGTNRIDLLARSQGLSTAEARAYGRALCRRCTGEPVQHITGEQGFRHLVLSVRPGVFVPRPETERLVDVALELLKGNDEPIVVDVGTGTGAVALALKHERPDVRVWGTDSSPAAIELARDNARELNLDVTFIEGELFAGLPRELRGGVDLVVSNPPYIAAEDHAGLPLEVRADPYSALIAPPGLLDQLLEAGAAWLGRGGAVAVEIGGSQAAAAARSAGRSGFGDVQIHQDLTGRDRVLSARVPAPDRR